MLRDRVAVYTRIRPKRPSVLNRHNARLLTEGHTVDLYDYGERHDDDGDQKIGDGERGEEVVDHVAQFSVSEDRHAQQNVSERRGQHDQSERRGAPSNRSTRRHRRRRVVCNREDSRVHLRWPRADVVGHGWTLHARFKPLYSSVTRSYLSEFTYIDYRFNEKFAHF